MAIRLDADALLVSVGQALSELGREHLVRERVRDLEAEDGGAGAVLADPDRGLLDVWVGVVNGELTGECDCVDGASGDLCGHAVAVALAALEEGVTFSSISSRARGVDPEEQRFAEIAAELDPRELIGPGVHRPAPRGPGPLGEDDHLHRRGPMRELDDLISEIVVDCYDEDECMTAFCTVLEDEIPVPFETVFLGMPVEVIAIGAGRAPGVVATCRRGTETGEVDLTSLTFPDGSVAAWLQAAYLRYLGHDPGRPSPPPKWRLRSWDQQ